MAEEISKQNRQFFILVEFEDPLSEEDKINSRPGLEKTIGALRAKGWQVDEIPGEREKILPIAIAVSSQEPVQRIRTVFYDLRTEYCPTLAYIPYVEQTKRKVFPVNYH